MYYHDCQPSDLSNMECAAHPNNDSCCSASSGHTMQSIENYLTLKNQNYNNNNNNHRSSHSTSHDSKKLCENVVRLPIWLQTRNESVRHSTNQPNSHIYYKVNTTGRTTETKFRGGLHPYAIDLLHPPSEQKSWKRVFLAAGHPSSIDLELESSLDAQT